MRLLLDTGATAIHCPSASMKGAYGAFTNGRFPELIAAGGSVGLGTDGPAAACFLDMFREVHLAATGHKEARLDWTLISPYQALELATIGSARAMLLEDEIGTLEPGKRADVVLLDLMRPEMVPWHEDNLLANLVYSGSGSLVHTVLVDGRVVVRGGEVLTMDETGDPARDAEGGAALRRALARVGREVLARGPRQAARLQERGSRPRRRAERVDGNTTA